MSRPFLITSLPRSRTAWFSVAATTPRSICYHEPIAECQSFEALKHLWLEKACGVSIGVSDSSLLFQIERILEEVKPRTLIIERDPGEAVQSFIDYMHGSGCAVDAKYLCNYCALAVDKMDVARKNPLCMFVRYDALVDRDVVARCLEWLMPGEDFPDLGHLMRMNIQSMRNYNLALPPHSMWHMPADLRRAAA